MNVAPRPIFASGISSPRSIGVSLHTGAPVADPQSGVESIYQNGNYQYKGPTAIITRPAPPISTVGTPHSPQLPIGVPRANPVTPTAPIVNNGSGWVTNYSGTGGSLGAPVAAPVRVSPRSIGSGLFA